MTKSDFIKFFDVSRETIKDFFEYERLLFKWNSNINLVSKKTLGHTWRRHFIDSGQLVNHVHASGKRWVDIGSGAGFPGLVVGLLLRDRQIECDLVLIEKNKKKVFFLNEVIRKLKLRIKVLNEDVFLLDNLNGDIFTARAFAELNKLLEIAFHHGKEKSVCLFLKGENYQFELDKTLKYWFFDYYIYNSVSSFSGKVIRVKNISKR